jgi:hypothetical protein
MRDFVLQVRLGTDELAALDRVAAGFALSRSLLVCIWIEAADRGLGDEGELPPVATELPSLDELLAGFDDSIAPSPAPPSELSLAPAPYALGSIVGACHFRKPRDGI